MRRRGGEEPLIYKNTTRWFELAVVFGLTSIGEILLGHCEEGRLKRQRVVTVSAGGAFGVLVSATAGRGLAPTNRAVGRCSQGPSRPPSSAFFRTPEKIAGFLRLFPVRCVFNETCQCLAKIYLPPTLTA